MTSFSFFISSKTNVFHLEKTLPKYSNCGHMLIDMINYENSLLNFIIIFTCTVIIFLL